jgi:alcohol dehydrogenase
MFTGPHRVEWREVAAPVVDGPDQALVQPIAVATCDLDVMLLRGKAPMFGAGFPLGHECVARVLEVSEDVTSVKPGDVVVPSFQICCGTCARCRRGLTGNCERVRGTAMYGIGALGGDHGGAFSDVMKIPHASAMLVPLPDTLVAADVASISDNVADAWRTVVPHLQRRAGSSVLIFGGGSIGLYAIQIALASGASRVEYVDDDRSRLELAGRLGAAVTEWTSERRLGRHPITVEASGKVEGLHRAIRATDPDGVCTSVGIHPGEATTMPLFDMYITGMTFITGRGHSRAVLPAVLEMAASGAIEPARITSQRVAWKDAVDALAEPPDKLVVVRD